MSQSSDRTVAEHFPHKQDMQMHLLVVNIYLKIKKKSMPLSGVSLKHRPMREKKFAALCIFIALLLPSAWPANADGISASAVSYEVLQVLPHDVSHFTQGLAIRDGRLIESTGLYAQSALFQTDLASGRVLHRYPLPDSVFGEGLAFHDEHIYLLSWREQRGFVFDQALRLLREFRYDGEGWGLASDGRRLIRSDGSSRLAFVDPRNLDVTQRLQVMDGERPVEDLNELEYAHGWILANIWYSDRVALIDPDSGRVGGWLDLSGLRARLAQPLPSDAVLNGLAYDATSDRLYATGKRWPSLFAIKVRWPPASAANRSNGQIRPAP